MRKYSSEGFTLLEILIVIVILGLLIAIGIAYYSNMTNRANAQVCSANRKTLETARAYYYSEAGSYGENIDEIREVLGLMNAEDIYCPVGGLYIFVGSSVTIICSIERHNR